MTRALAILTSVHGARDGDALLLDRKAREGLEFYARHWSGPVFWMLTLQNTPPSYSDRYMPADLPFTVIDVAADRTDVAAKLPEDALLVASADSFTDLHLAARIPGRVVYIIEYTLKTRLDIVRETPLPWYRAARRKLWERTTERRRKTAMAAAAGLQCNGLPSFNLYGAGALDSMFFFDTRLTDANQITPELLVAKQARVRGERPLRLAFSGRLNRMKGVHQILPLIKALDRRDTAYVLEIFGDGELADTLRLHASEKLILHGSVAFPGDWVKAMQERIDLFVCPHAQGDPSCTYMETLGCGVPIAGFANEAWKSMSALDHLGVAVPIGDVEALAQAFADLDRDRDRLADMMSVGARFSAAQSMEKAFNTRLAHLAAVAERIHPSSRGG